MSRIALTGATGLLGNAILENLSGSDVCVLGRGELNADMPEVVEQALSMRPDILVNCAAHTDVEAAEHNPSIDFVVNARLPGLLGQICARQNTLLVHFSSTGCYGNWKDEPYSEEDPLRPPTVHHRAKAAGERAIRESGCAHLIFRTGWLYGGIAGAAKNFVWKRLVEASRAAQITSDATQRGNPSYVRDVAYCAIAAAQGGARGTFNLVSHGNASRYQYVAAIVAASKLGCEVKPGPAFRRLAPVSANETAVNDKLKAAGFDRMGSWQVSLGAYVSELMRSTEWRALQN